MPNPRSVIITGASSGIGAALTKALADDGYQLYICARRADRLQVVSENGRLATPFVCDVSSEAEVARFVRGVAERAGPLYALINCAGVYGAIGPVSDSDSAEWMHATQVNLFGTFLMIKHAARLMKASDRPRIVNFAGGGAFNPLPRCSSYAVSKAAVVRLTETLAIEFADRNIAVNAVAPGFVATEIHNAALAAGPELAGAEYYELTRARMKAGSVPVSVPVGLVRFLLSPAAARLTGKTIAASFDPWDESTFATNIDAINKSSLYTMQRINLTHLAADDPLRRMAPAPEPKKRIRAG